jgi:hypothetical protein
VKAMLTWIQDHERRITIQRSCRQPSQYGQSYRKVPTDGVRRQRAQARGAAEQRDQVRAAYHEARPPEPTQRIEHPPRSESCTYSRNDIHFICFDKVISMQLQLMSPLLAVVLICRRQMAIRSRCSLSNDIPGPHKHTLVAQHSQTNARLCIATRK